MSNSTIILKYINQEDKSVVEHNFDVQRLIAEPDQTIFLKLSDEDYVALQLKHGLLKIVSDAAVDILFSEILPILAMHVQTAGMCEIAIPQYFEYGAYINARKIKLNAVLSSKDFLCLIAHDPIAGIEINHDIQTYRLFMYSEDVDLKADLSANFAHIFLQKLHIDKKAKIRIKSDASSHAIQEQDAAPLDTNKHINDWRSIDLKDIICTIDLTILNIDECINAGQVLIDKAVIESKSIKCHPNSIMGVDTAAITTQELHVNKHALVKGISLELQVSAACLVDGKVLYTNIHAKGIYPVINGIMFAKDSLRAEFKEGCKVFGLLGSKNKTYIKAPYISVSAVNSNDLYDFSLKPMHEAFRKGGIVSEHSLHISSIATMLYAGGYISAPNIDKYMGVYINLLGFNWAFNSTHMSLLFDIDLGLNMPWFAAENSDYVNPEKFIRNLFRFAGNLNPVLKNGLSTGVFLKTLIDHMRSTGLPKILSAKNQETANADKNEESGYSISSMKQFLNSSMKNVAEQMSKMSLIDLVESLLKAKGYYTQYNAILYHATNTAAFVHNVKSGINSPKAAFDSTKMEFRNFVDACKWKNKKSNKEVSADNRAKESAKLKHAAITMLQEMIEPVNVFPKVKYSFNQPYEILSGIGRGLYSVNPFAISNEIFSSMGDKLLDLKHAAMYGLNETSSSLDQTQESVLWTGMQELLIMAGPSIYKTSLISLQNGLYTFSASIIEDYAFARSDGFLIAANSSLNCLYDYTNSGSIYGLHRYESVRNRYNFGALHVRYMHLHARKNYEAGVFKPTAGLIYSTEFTHVKPGAKFAMPRNTHANVTGDLIADEDIKLSGNVSVDGVLHVADGKQVDVDLANLHVKGATGPGVFKVDRSKVHIEEADILENSRFIMSDSVYTGRRAKWHNNSQIEFIRSFLDIDSIEDEQALVKTLNTFIKTKMLERGGEWEFAELLSITTEHISSKEASTLTGAEGSHFDLVAQTYACFGAECLESASKYVKNIPSQEALDLALSQGQYSNQTVYSSIQITTDSKDSVVFKGSRADGAHVIFNTGGIIRLGPEFERARDVTFTSYQEALEFVSRYATYNLPPPPKDKRRGLKKVGKILSKTAKCVAVTFAAASNPIASLAAGSIALATDRAIKKDDVRRNKKLEARNLELADKYRQGDISVLEQQHKMEQAMATRQWYAEHAQELQKRLENPQTIVSANDAENYSRIALDSARSQAQQNYDQQKSSINGAYEQLKRDIKYQASQQRTHIKKSGDFKIGTHVGVQGGAKGANVVVGATAGVGRQEATGQQTVWKSAEDRVPRTQENTTSNRTDHKQQEPKQQDNKPATTLEVSVRVNNAEVRAKVSESCKSNCRGSTNLAAEEETHKLNAQSKKVATDRKVAEKSSSVESSIIKLQFKIDQLQELKQRYFSADLSLDQHKFYSADLQRRYLSTKEEYFRKQKSYVLNASIYEQKMAQLKELKFGFIENVTVDLVRADLEETLGAKVFAQKKQLDDLQTAMRSYICEDLDRQINACKNQIAKNEFIAEREERALAGKSSILKDSLGRAGVAVGHTMRAAGAKVNGTIARHPDAVNIAKVSGIIAATAAPVMPTLAGLAAYQAVSAPSVRHAIGNASRGIFRRLGVDSVNSRDLGDAVASSTAFVAAGVVGAGAHRTWADVVRTRAKRTWADVVRTRAPAKQLPSRLTSASSTPTFDQIKSFSVKAELDGAFYPKEKLTLLVKYLEKRGVNVYGTDRSPCFRGVRNGPSQIYLPGNPTVLQVKHELSHWLDFKQLGFDNYAKLSTYQREKLVLERLQGNRIWEGLNKFEKEFSIDYVNRVKEGYRHGAYYE